MIILIDIDDTISNFSEVLINHLNRLNNTNFKKEDISDWDWYKNHFENPWKPTEYKNFWDDIVIDKNSINLIEKLVENGHEVYLVTASFPSDSLGYKVRKTLSNFKENLLNESNIIICSNKHIIKGDLRIDDGIHNLDSNSINILFDQPWNRNIIKNKNIPKFKRVKNWKEIENILL